MVSGPALECRIGTLRLINLVVVLVAVLGVLYMSIALGGVLTTYPHFWNECAVGFSGVIFALITAESLTVCLFVCVCLCLSVSVPVCVCVSLCVCCSASLSFSHSPSLSLPPPPSSPLSLSRFVPL